MLAMDAAPSSYQSSVEAALAAGASVDEVVGTVIAVAPTVGLTRGEAADPMQATVGDAGGSATALRQLGGGILLNRRLQLVGVHAIGQGASELIHIGQMVMAFQGTIDYFIENTFNYPTLAECYRVAALNGYNKVMTAVSRSTLSYYGSRTKSS